MVYIFQVIIHYSDGTKSQLHIKARDDVTAREEAIQVDAADKRVSFCEIVKICTLDNEE